jgi:hypothetical protein
MWRTCSRSILPQSLAGSNGSSTALWRWQLAIFLWILPPALYLIPSTSQDGGPATPKTAGFFNSALS